jgi:hypothetical protein
MTQNAAGNWVSGDFMGAPGADHVKGMFDGSDYGRFKMTDTGTNNLKEAMEIVKNKLVPNDTGEADYILFNTDAKTDAKILDKMKEFAGEYASAKNQDNPYRLLGNSCLDAAYDLLGAGGISILNDLGAPNLTMAYMLDMNFMLNLALTNIMRSLAGEPAITCEPGHTNGDADLGDPALR